MTNLSLVLFLVVQLCLIKLSLTFEYSPIVQTTKGPVKGRVFTTIRESKRYHSYRGIPYAQPPTGYLKFAAPKEPNAWKDVFDASKEGNLCPQILNNKFVGNEDCLQLNVYTPQLPKNGTEPKAVLCWIFGGSFIRGQNMKKYYSPDYIIEEDLILVSINYRLGALGFLSLENKNASGNAGLKDQSLALKWVQDNIHNFGGDPKKVTLMGISAGSASVGYQLLSERSKGLFRNTISMSGAPLCFWAFDRPEQVRSKVMQIARRLGYNGTRENLLEFYYNVNVQSLTEVIDNYSSIDLPMRPVLEDANYVPDAFISECSLKKYMSGNFNHGPVMMGYTKNETLIYLATKKSHQELIDNVMAYSKKLQCIQHIRSLYSPAEIFKNDTSKDNYSTTTIQFTSDVAFIAPIDYTQKLLSKYNDPIYYYRYDFDYDNSLHKIDYGVDINGSAHGDEIVMIFYSDRFKIDPNANNSITLLQKRMTRMWANMAKYGNPTPNGTNDNLLNIVWPDSRKSGKMLWLNEELKIHDRYKDPIIDIVQFGIKHFGAQSNGCNLNYTKKAVKTIPHN
ncbi:PREDICTED: cholinesterase 2-like [Polistes dominula]|uniref:Carboxylic ester hydrolase n=1 Tax=Polistes dominula TaxID=743375 RepID=A0ABM1HV35_POLDO|nr:PREDICTED: cholinesterase 2-like [Polistes dominula]